MSDITREQYDNAVRIRDNGYSCRDPIHLDCTKCFGYSLPCGNEGNLIDDRVAIVGSTISTYEAEHPEEFRKTPDPGEGWRWLEVGKDVIQEGDATVESKGYVLIKSRYWGDSVCMETTFCRRIAKSPRIYDYRDVELPEVQELIGKEVYVSDYIFTMLTEGKPYHSNLESCEISTRPFVDSCGTRWQFIRAIDEPTIRLTRAELIAIAATSRGVTPEQIEIRE